MESNSRKEVIFFNVKMKNVSNEDKDYFHRINQYEDGTVEDWYKYERIKVLQDEYGRAVQANFAVIDTLRKRISQMILTAQKTSVSHCLKAC